MASKALASTSFLILLNILFFTLVTSTYTPCPPPPSPIHKLPPSPIHKLPPSPKPVKIPPKVKSPPKSPSPVTPSPVTPSPATCPRDALKLGVCANVLSGLIGVSIGTPPKEPCCSLLHGLLDVEAAVCLCTAIKANVLGLHLNVGVDLSLLLNYCGKKVPSGFICA